MPNVSRYKEAPERLQKLVITQLGPDYFRAHLMQRKNAGETWRDVWKFDGSGSAVRSMLIGFNFLQFF